MFLLIGEWPETVYEWFEAVECFWERQLDRIKNRAEQMERDLRSND
jgi:hypothetical protein